MGAEAETEVEKAEKLATPGDEGLGVEKISDEAIEEIVKAVATVQKILKGLKTTIESNLPGALPSVKAGLDKLMERTKAAQEKLAGVERKTKDQRERAQAAQFVKTAKEKVDEAELPFLKGIESLPLQEAM